MYDTILQYLKVTISIVSVKIIVTINIPRAIFILCNPKNIGVQLQLIIIWSKNNNRINFIFLSFLFLCNMYADQARAAYIIVHTVGNTKSGGVIFDLFNNLYHTMLFLIISPMLYDMLSNIIIQYMANAYSTILFWFLSIISFYMLQTH